MLGIKKVCWQHAKVNFFAQPSLSTSQVTWVSNFVREQLAFDEHLVLLQAVQVFLALSGLVSLAGSHAHARFEQLCGLSKCLSPSELRHQFKAEEIGFGIFLFWFLFRF